MDFVQGTRFYVITYSALYLTVLFVCCRAICQYERCFVNFYCDELMLVSSVGEVLGQFCFCTLKCFVKGVNMSKG